MSTIQLDGRTYPLKKPPQHKVPVPRWSVKFPDSVTHLHTLYIGVQSHDEDHSKIRGVEEKIDSLVFSHQKDTATEKFRVTEGFDLPATTVWVIYSTFESTHSQHLTDLSPLTLWSTLPSSTRTTTGIWTESFSASLDRLETTYARLAHRPGLSALPGVTQPPHEISAYWGSARDRVPAAAHDLFPMPEDVGEGELRPETVPRGLGERLTGSNYEHMCHIRSGQWWEECGEEERVAYEDDLRVGLMGGMRYLWANAEDTGTIGLRFLQNVDGEGKGKKETCGCGFFRNWKDLEQWASRQKSHLAIYNGAMRHAKRFGDERKFMTWHEVWIFKAGEVKFDYVNCAPMTGVISHVVLQKEALRE